MATDRPPILATPVTVADPAEPQDPAFEALYREVAAVHDRLLREARATLLAARQPAAPYAAARSSSGASASVPAPRQPDDTVPVEVRFMVMNRELADALKEIVPGVTNAVIAEALTLHRRQLDSLAKALHEAMRGRVRVDDPQVLRNARSRAEFVRDYGLWTAEELADALGSTAANRSAAASTLRRRGKIFAVWYDGRDQYPRFQFDLETGRPHPVVAGVLKRFGKRLQGWQIALWFVSRNAWLPGDTKPVDLLRTAPDAVLDAAGRQVAERAY